jgi:HK97 family phage portal protein
MVDLSDYAAMLSTGGYTRLADSPEVLAVVDEIAKLVSNMSLHLMQASDTGAVRVRNELARLIDVNPAHNMTRKMWVTKMVRDLFLYGDGNSIAQIVVQPGSDYLSQLRPFDMSQVSYMYDENSDELTVRYKGREFGSNQLLHVTLNPDPRYPQIGTGYSRITKPLIDDLAGAQNTKSTFMSGRYMPNLIVAVDSDAEGLASKEGRDKIRKKYLESDSGEPWIIPSDMLNVEQVKPMTLNDLAINDTVEVDKKTIASIFGVPAFLIGVGEFNKEEYNNFINTTIASVGNTIAQAMTKDVLISTQMYFQFDPRSLYSYDLDEQVTAGATMVDHMAMTRNELRSWLGLEPREDMEQLLALENYIPEDRLGDQGKLTGNGDDITKGGDANDPEKAN